MEVKRMPYKEEIAVPEVEPEKEPGKEPEPEKEPEPDEKPEKEPEKTPEEVSVESLAREMGWKPSDDFQGHKDDYVDAATFIRRSKDIQDTMRQHLKENKKKLTSFEKALDDFKSHSERVFKAQLASQREQIKQLQKDRRAAIEEGDIERVDDIENQLTDIVRNVEPERTTEPEPDSEEVEVFEEWLGENQWFGVPKVRKGDPDMTEYALRLADEPKFKALPYARRLKKVTEAVKDMFPEHFKPRDKTTPPPVSPVEAPKPASRKKKFTARDLNEQQKSVMRNMVKSGVMSEQEYIDDLVKIGELG